MDYLLQHMPSFDLQFLPPSVTVEGFSMLDDNIAFALMAWNASGLLPKPPLQVAFSYFLPYASYHEPRTNWRPLFFAKYFGMAGKAVTSRKAVDALIAGGTPLMKWTAHTWADFPGSRSNTYNLGPFAPSSTPPVVGPFDFTAYGYASCTGWATFLASALKAVGVPARQVGAPCWNTAEFAGPATSNPNVSACWSGGPPDGPYGGKYLNNHNWVEYWDNEAGDWHFVDVASSSSSESTWFCTDYSENEGCSCTSNAGKAARDHEILAVTWTDVAEASLKFDGGRVLDVATELHLTTGEAVSPLVWSPRLRSPLGTELKDVGLRAVNRTAFYRCRSGSPTTSELLANRASAGDGSGSGDDELKYL
mmetsp:Transcript_96030/g.176474  ORF Transcript_96030/g.176474 Transcript_96030/m.176474 type:complete len:364 (-) Transcript_96030:3-1094(-)